MSNWNPCIVKIERIEVHPNADNLEIAQVEGNPVVVGKNTFSVGKRGVASIEFRTSHNGYYAGNIESCPWEYLYLSQRTNFSRTTNRIIPTVLAEVIL